MDEEHGSSSAVAGWAPCGSSRQAAWPWALNRRKEVSLATPSSPSGFGLLTPKPLELALHAGQAGLSSLLGRVLVTAVAEALRPHLEEVRVPLGDAGLEVRTHFKQGV
jgi:hypothetical protein